MQNRKQLRNGNSWGHWGDETGGRNGGAMGINFWWSYFNLVVVSNMFYFHPYLGKWSNLTNIFLMGWNHQLVQLEDLGDVELLHSSTFTMRTGDLPGIKKYSDRFPGEPYVLRVPSHQLGCATWHLTRWGYGIPKGKETNFPTIRGFVYPGEDVLLVFWRVPPPKKNSRHEYENSNPRMSKSPWSWRRSKILEVQKIGVPPNRLPGRKVNPEEVGWNRRKLRSWSLVGFYGRLYSSRLVVVSYISETIKR